MTQADHTAQTGQKTPLWGDEIPTDFAFQDEHPQVRLPFSAIIDDRKVEGHSLSLTQAVVRGLLPPALEGQEELVTLRFDFDGFAVNLFAEAFVHKDGAADDPQVRLVFSDPTGEHLAPLRYILNGSIAGDVVSVGQLLGFSGSARVPSARATPTQSPILRLRSLSRLAAIFALSAGLVYGAASIVHQRVAYQYESRPVVVSAGGTLLRATSAGQISYLNPAAQKGEVIYAINANSGAVLATQMPCDCRATLHAGLFDGATVLTGEPLVTLAREDARVRITAEVSDAGIARMIKGDQAEIELLSGDVLPVSLRFETGTGGAATDGFASAEVILPPPFAQRITPGEVARLRFRNVWAFAGIWARQNVNEAAGS
ncbi:hypothetical protein N6L24_10485 [Cognatishimia sp. SS12]|uniref:hypothetical protein n=1 Tax=Cognatishimia sp. SS12 TaxID=2979465 RepID=UPI00232CDFB9|nr:hypothetical protein [Cognatishimia sp. SS12]MDC0738708.1 hypothetical protein [Cognatishimia sp. SS12]